MIVIFGIIKHQKKLFLLGDTIALNAVVNNFIQASGGDGARISLLLQEEKGWIKHKSEYLEKFQQLGVSDIFPIFPEETGEMNLEFILTKLNDSTGIIMGGGNTLTYHRLYTSEPIKKVIHEKYQLGVPFMGVSAGALLSLEKCTILAEDNSVNIKNGLGLVKDFVIGVHFSEPNRLTGILETMAKTKTKVGWGLENSACAVFEDSKFIKAIGHPVYKILMTNFETRAYTMTQYDPT